VFVSGMIGWDAEGVFHTDDFAGQVRQALRTSSRCWPRRRGPEHIVRMTWYVLDKRIPGRLSGELGAAYREIIGKHYPAMTAVQVAGLIEDRARVEIEVTAVVPMAVISLSSAQLAFGHVALLDHADFSIETGERVGLIGRNGTGKSSLLKIISGRSKLDDGLLVMQQGVKIAYVEQEPSFDPAMTVFDAVAGGMGEQQAMLAEYEALTGQFGQGDDDALMERMHELQVKLDATDAWNLGNKVETTLDRLGLNGDAQMGTLSGGMQKRVALAVALVSAPDVLLLDEPTNHLDFTSIQWLEGLLREFRGSVLFITHDRRFLDNVATRIIELDRGRCCPSRATSPSTRSARPSCWRTRKSRTPSSTRCWPRKKCGSARACRRAAPATKAACAAWKPCACSARRARPAGPGQARCRQGERSGKIVAELENVSKHYGDKVIIRTSAAPCCVATRSA
jgi:ATP-binding cassette subfamily F protein uup